MSTSERIKIITQYFANSNTTIEQLVIMSELSDDEFMRWYRGEE